jgi:hypothetical protein
MEASLPASSEAPSGAVPSGPEATGVSTSLDPCQLVPVTEASQLAGTAFTAGRETTTEGGGRICTYGAQTVNVLQVIVGQAPDVATAKAEEAAVEAQVKEQALGAPVTVTKITGIGDDAGVMTLSLPAYSISGIAIFVLKGTVFFSISDIVRGAAAPTEAAMRAEAQLVLGRVP